MNLRTAIAACLVVGLAACQTGGPDTSTFECAAFLGDMETESDTAMNLSSDSEYGQDLLDKYTSFALTTDLSMLSDNECRMIPYLIEASKAMEEIFWLQAYGNRDELLASIEDPALRTFARINYGPWDRLDNEAPFLDGVAAKPDGANLYPRDMSKEEFEKALAADPELASLYTVVVRDAD